MNKFGLWVPPRDCYQFSFGYYARLEQWFDRHMVNYYNWWTNQLQYQEWSGILQMLTGTLSQVKLWLQVGEEEMIRPGMLIGDGFSACAQYSPWHALAGIVMWDECAWNIMRGRYGLSNYQTSCRRIRSMFPSVSLMDVEPTHIISQIYQQYSSEVNYFGGNAYGNDSDSYAAQYGLQFSNAQTIMQAHGTAAPFIVLKYGNGRSKENVLGAIRGAIAGGIASNQIYFWADPLENIVAFSNPPSAGWLALTGAIEEWQLKPVESILIPAETIKTESYSPQITNPMVFRK